MLFFRPLMGLKGNFMVTSGAISAIMKNPAAEGVKPHLLQIFQIFPSSTSRRALKLTDGTHYIRAVISGPTILKNFDIIRVMRFRFTEIKGTSILLVDSFTVVYTGLNSLLGKSIEALKEAEAGEAAGRLLKRASEDIEMANSEESFEENKCRAYGSRYNSYVSLQKC
eukprot:TRINITY_DN16466_c0_g1_i2.p1 TRINITY_DN16466_c0_g1~~TRINITY_DN16466_c0_g1_i2.p1  ORF type:complete len:168 (-),score=32.47 TRINITY_DN16466_c0_g1_i2:234-737(-)